MYKDYPWIINAHRLISCSLHCVSYSRSNQSGPCLRMWKKFGSIFYCSQCECNELTESKYIFVSVSVDKNIQRDMHCDDCIFFCPASEFNELDRCLVPVFFCFHRFFLSNGLLSKFHRNNRQMRQILPPIGLTHSSNPKWMFSSIRK